jgi:outer membrane protein assembly factor BamB
MACACGQPLVADSTLYVVESQAQRSRLTLHAFDAAGGMPKWSTTLASKASGDTLAAVANGLVYATVHPSSGSDQLIALDAATGKRRWKLTPPTPGTGAVRIIAPVVDGRLAFVAATASSATELSAIDPTGHVVWSAMPGGTVGDFPPPDPSLATNPGHTIYIATLSLTAPANQLLTGYDESDGTVHSAVSVQPTPAGPIQSIAYSNGLILGTAGTGFGRLGFGAFGLDPDTGAVLWTTDIFTVAVTFDAVITSDARSSSITARNPTTGAVMWSVVDNIGDRVALAGNLMYTWRPDTIVIRRLSDGNVVGTAQPNVGEFLTGRVIPSNGRLYATTTGHLYALAPS